MEIQMSLKSGLDLLILLLYANEGEEVRGTTRLMKMLFLLVKEGGFEDLEDEFEYEGYDYGPFSSEVYNFIETGKETGLIKEEKAEFLHYEEIADDLRARAEAYEGRRSMSSKERDLKLFGLTEKGMKVGKALSERIEEERRKNIQNIKRKINKKHPFKILEYVYAKYPEYATESKIEALRVPDVDEELLKLVGSHSPLPLEEEEKKIKDIIKRKVKK